MVKKKKSLKWVSGKTVNISENDKENHWVSVHGLNSPPPIISYRTQTHRHTDTHTLLFFSVFSFIPRVYKSKINLERES
ncbi:hypothetical protein L2E82_34846 [Cichorium intybus]|uniref:Uncharacterized protein n=1 Tax=Cichorium intybus TaxID=13427 RepID=A0ACB9BMT5_CICIN|nr:hypothetical protein L2E82_34846 [Cichorium intybus]